MPETTPLIGIDLDGVLVDYVYHLTSLGQLRYGVKAHSTGGQASWGVWDGFTPEQISALMSEADYLPRFWEQAPSLIGEGELAELGAFMRKHEGVILTNRKPSTANQTYNWLKERGLDAWEVVFTEDKAKEVIDLGLSIVLEDSPSNIEAYIDLLLNKEVPTLKIYARDWEYNRYPYMSSYNFIDTVTSVSEFLNKVS